MAWLAHLYTASGAVLALAATVAVVDARFRDAFMLLAGAQDVEAGAVSFRYRDGSQRNGIAIEPAIEQIAAFVASRNNASPTAEPA